MKWVFYLLVVANIWYFSSHISALQPVSEVTAPAPPPTNAVNQLLMLSELEAGELRERSQASTAGASDAGASAAPPASASVPVPPSSNDAGSTVRTAIDDEPAGRETASASVNSRTRELPQGICLSFGPLAEEVSIKDLRVWLAKFGGVAELRERERRELSRYWVFFPPFPSRAEAVKRVEDMRNKGVEDIFIIPRGDMGNAISLGVYSRKTSLDRRLGEMRRKGYEPTVSPRFKTERASWLDAVFPEDFKLDSASFASAFGAIEVSDINCTRQALARLPRLPARTKVTRDSTLPNGSGEQGSEAALPRKDPAPARAVVEIPSDEGPAFEVPAATAVQTPARTTPLEVGAHKEVNQPITGKSDENLDNSEIKLDNSEIKEAERVVTEEPQTYNSTTTKRAYLSSSPVQQRNGADNKPTPPVPVLGLEESLTLPSPQ